MFRNQISLINPYLLSMLILLTVPVAAINYFRFHIRSTHQAVLSTEYSLSQRPHSPNTLMENIRHLCEHAHKIVH